MVILLLSLLSLVTPNLFVFRLDTATEEGFRYAEHHAWCKNLNFLKCGIVPGFCKLGHNLFNLKNYRSNFPAIATVVVFWSWVCIHN